MAKNLVGQGQGLLLKAKDLTFKAKAKDSKFILEDICQGPRPRTTTLHCSVGNEVAETPNSLHGIM